MKNIDPELQLVIAELNSVGLATKFSCAGHENSGYISFEQVYPNKRKRDVRRILKQEDFDNIRFFTSIPTKDWHTNRLGPARDGFSMVIFDQA